jgi:hypothetical protein
MFVGRVPELQRLESVLVQTKAGNPQSFLITGERGIGKTSLLDFIKWAASGQVSLLGSKSNIRFLVVHIDIEASTTRLSLIKKIERALHFELAKTESARSFLKGAWDFISRIEAGGVAMREQTPQDEESLLDEFGYSLAATVSRVVEASEDDLFAARYDGLLLLVDEADNACEELGLGAFVKLTMERLQRRGCTRACFGLAGLPELPTVLTKSHPSALRVFEQLKLDALSADEVGRVVEVCLAKANEQNPTSTTIDDNAKAALVMLSEGYPHFIQQFGYSAFEYDTDNVLSVADVMSGAVLGKGCAIEAIGDRYYRDAFYNKIKKDSYREVLRIMAEKSNEWVTKSDIKAKFKGKGQILDNALNALRKRHIILCKEGSKGVYRLQHRGFALWINLRTKDVSGSGLIAPDAPASEPSSAGVKENT